EIHDSFRLGSLRLLGSWRSRYRQGIRYGESIRRFIVLAWFSCSLWFGHLRSFTKVNTPPNKSLQPTPGSARGLPGRPGLAGVIRPGVADLSRWAEEVDIAPAIDDSRRSVRVRELHVRLF